MGADPQIQRPGSCLRKAAHPQAGVSQGGGRGQDEAAEFEVIPRLAIEVELVAGGGTGGGAVDTVKIDSPPQVVEVEGIAQGAVGVQGAGKIGGVGVEGDGIGV